MAERLEKRKQFKFVNDIEFDGLLQCCNRHPDS